jgi:hypothetical protein
VGPAPGGPGAGQGASQLEVRLPRPAGVVPVHIRGGASQVRIRQPAGVPVQLRVGSGVADLRFDEQEWGAVGGGLRLATPEATQVPRPLRDRERLRAHVPEPFPGAPRRSCKA